MPVGIKKSRQRSCESIIIEKVRLYRLIERGETVELSVDVDAKLFDDQPGQNVIWLN